MATKINKDSLFGEWVHSREEDTDDEAVFRQSNYDFPLTRGPRETFALGTDGSLINGNPSASDALDESKGTWKLEDDKIAFYNGSKLTQRRSIASVNKEKLVLKKF